MLVRTNDIITNALDNKTDEAARIFLPIGKDRL